MYQIVITGIQSADDADLLLHAIAEALPPWRLTQPKVELDEYDPSEEGS